ncbi:pentatricopeptide repeat-containing protein At2g15630, mitochondrial-like [Lotus japonicus]|uniref:pentatricopeptide repeat-containing protein At2g15630, mitochondrial-like n=1 Tax=Lotus japonicus TaxID=34305 RepID=UPI00258B3783|nr:pentatricopeptide repeat-containing protein At2g15630, mitochondrial-like [Lotus japonicus]
MKEKGVLPNIETCNDMLMLFLKLNRNLAEEFISHMESIGVKPAIYKYNTLIHDGAKFEVACVIFERMKDTGLFLDAYSYNSYNFVMYKERGLEETSDLLPKMLESESESGLVPHAVIYDALIDKWCKIGVVECYEKQNTEDLDKAIAYKDEMISRGIEPTIVTYTLLIEALFEIGSGLRAEDMIEEMQEKGLKSDVYTYNTLMSGHAKCKLVDAPLVFYEEMVEKMIQPNLVTYNNMMLMRCRYSKMKEARQLLDEMKRKGFKLDHITYNLIIGGYCDDGEVNEAFRVRDEMLKNGFDPTITTYDALIIGLCNNNEVEHAEELLKEMVSKDICTPNDRTYKVLTKTIKETTHKVGKNDVMGNARFRNILENDKYLPIFANDMTDDELVS